MYPVDSSSPKMWGKMYPLKNSVEKARRIEQDKPYIK